MEANRRIIAGAAFAWVSRWAFSFLVLSSGLNVQFQLHEKKVLHLDLRAELQRGLLVCSL